MPLFGAQASNMHPHAERLQAAKRVRMTVTRFSSAPDFHHARHTVWEKRNGRFYGSGRKMRNHVQMYERDCDSYLADQQRFPLSKMIGRDYITDEAAAKYLLSGLKSDPGQMNFFQMNRDVSEVEAERMFKGELKKHVNDLLRDYGDSTDLPIITAALWTVAGQVLDPLSGAVQKRPMPWQRSGSHKRPTLDRKKHRFVWEIGRTAQDLPREAEPLAAAALATIYQELIAYGGRIEDAYVTFHSSGAVNTRAYLLRFPGSLYPKDWPDRNDAVFLVPLAEAMRQARLNEHSQTIHEIFESLGGRLNEAQVLELLREFDRIAFTQLDHRHVSGVRYPGPLALRDFSIGAAHKRVNLMRMIGLTRDNDQLTRVLMARRPTYPMWDTGQYTDLSDTDLTANWYLQRKSLEISNLNAVAMRTDPRYVPKTLAAVMRHYVKTFVAPYEDAESIRRGLQFLKQQGVRFGVTTTNLETHRRLLELSPVDVGRVQVQGQAAQSPGMPWFHKEQRMALFTVDQIEAMSAGLPVPENTVQENIWARLLMLANPEVF